VADEERAGVDRVTIGTTSSEAKPSSLAAAAVVHADPHRRMSGCRELRLVREAGSTAAALRPHDAPID